MYGLEEQEVNRKSREADALYESDDVPDNSS